MTVLHDLLDHQRLSQSPIHRLSAGWKLASASAVVGLALAAPLAHAEPGLGVLLAFLLVAAAAGRLPVRFLARRLLLLEPFVLGVAVLALFRPHGVSLFVAMLARSNICLLAMILLSATTPFADVIKVLRRIGVPAILAEVLALMYRYLFVLADEAGRMSRARASRTFRGGRMRTWQTSAAIIGQLFLRSSSRAQRIYGAMCARGWR